ncbi:uncharacterized protein N7529_001256 [Penicillium soppii]|uniref:uncharacterized protein n=1 Tax=Penicillium soppii TaxID=69789 RepID=UPI0025486C6C|nr:uncharacterized protein N7529_001256 [Penicillium soppii]KAJ5882584.1 hypothetical protein N7529_001256 [Penicillium soppii]
MAASVIKQLQMEDVLVVYLFFRQIIDANHESIAALRDWLYQVFKHSALLQVKLQQSLKKWRSLNSLSPTDLGSDLNMASGG